MSWNINVKCQMSNVKLKLINDKCQISWNINVKCQGMSNVKRQITNVKYQMSNV